MTNKLSRRTTALTVKHFMTTYYILSIFIAILVNFITFPNFMTLYDFMTVCGSFAFIKEYYFGRTYIQLLFSGVFQEFLIFPGVYPRVKLHSRSFQEQWPPYIWRSLFLDKVAGIFPKNLFLKSLLYKRFPANFAKFHGTFFAEHLFATASTKYPFVAESTSSLNCYSRPGFFLISSCD